MRRGYVRFFTFFWIAQVGAMLWLLLQTLQQRARIAELPASPAAAELARRVEHQVIWNAVMLAFSCVLVCLHLSHRAWRD